MVFAKTLNSCIFRESTSLQGLVNEEKSDMEHEMSAKPQPYVVDSIVQPTGAYSHGIVVNGLLFTCGMGPSDGIADVSTLGGIEDQTRRTFKNLQSILNQKNVGLDRIVKLTAYLQNVERDFAGYNEVCREFLLEPYPARTTIGASLKGILICMDVVAQV